MSDSPGRIAQVNNLYAAMRPHVPGASYVNYCDLDLPDYATAYWGANLARLKQVKQAFGTAQAKASAKAKEFEVEARKILEALGDRAQAELKVLISQARTDTRSRIADLGVELALRLADRGYILESGRTILTGQSAELLQSAEVKRIFLGDLAL